MNIKTIIISFFNLGAKFVSKKLFFSKSSNLLLILMAGGIVSGVVNQEVANSVLILLQGISNIEIISWLFVAYFLWFIHGIIIAFRKYLIFKIGNMIKQESANGDK